MSRSHRPPLLLIGVAAAATLAISACASDAAPNWSFATAPSPAPVATAPAVLPAVAHVAAQPAPAATPVNGTTSASTASTPASQAMGRLDLTIVTGDMIGHTEFPAYIPSDFTLPAYSTITVTITNFDDATPLQPSLVSYANVSGTVGNSMEVTTIDPRYPNGSSGTTRELTKLAPKAVSHTFTIPALGINVPITAHSRTTFVIKTGAPGTFAWRCFDPCGNGPSGWGSAMAATKGFMEGTLVVA